MLIAEHERRERQSAPKGRRPTMSVRSGWSHVRAALLLLAVPWACGRDLGLGPDARPHPAAWRVAGCSNAVSPSGSCTPDNLAPAESDPCRAVLFWKFDQATQTLWFTETAYVHTCCAQISLDAGA